eukprot:1790061-Amphidinium_carterae.1
MGPVGTRTCCRKRTRGQSIVATGCQLQEEAIGYGCQRTPFAGSEGKTYCPDQKAHGIRGQAAGVAIQRTSEASRTTQGTCHCTCRPCTLAGGGPSGPHENSYGSARPIGGEPDEVRSGPGQERQYRSHGATAGVCGGHRILVCSGRTKTGSTIRRCRYGCAGRYGTIRQKEEGHGSRHPPADTPGAGGPCSWRRT